MRTIILVFSVVALIGSAWFFLTQAGVIPEIDMPINIFDKETLTQWFAEKIKEISELIGYEAGSI
jgi:hypothetical protein